MINNKIFSFFLFVFLFFIHIDFSWCDRAFSLIDEKGKHQCWMMAIICILYIYIFIWNEILCSRSISISTNGQCHEQHTRTTHTTHKHSPITIIGYRISYLSHLEFDLLTECLGCAIATKCVALFLVFRGSITALYWSFISVSSLKVNDFSLIEWSCLNRKNHQSFENFRCP